MWPWPGLQKSLLATSCLLVLSETNYIAFRIIAVEDGFTIVTTVLLQLAYVGIVCHVVRIHDSRQTATNIPYDNE